MQVPVETTMTPERMEGILHSFLDTGQLKCLSKHRISYSQLRAVKRHFAKGCAEHLKTREVRSRVLQNFTEVLPVIQSFVCQRGAFESYISRIRSVLFSLLISLADFSAAEGRRMAIGWRISHQHSRRNKSLCATSTNGSGWHVKMSSPLTVSAAHPSTPDFVEKCTPPAGKLTEN